MDIGLYREYLTQYVNEAIANSDGSNPGISEYLSNIRVSGIFVRHKDEKKRALADAREAFEEHRHWPQEIVISHLGIDRRPIDP
jgi:hypothetical protein